jgi:hypothetical protein
MTEWPSMDGENMMPVQEDICGFLVDHDFVVEPYELPPIPELHVIARGGTVLVCKRCGKVEPR